MREADPTDWSLEPWLIVTLGVAVFLYATGLRNLRRKSGRDRVVGAGEVSAFFAGTICIALALMSPIDTISDDLFSMHMVQHLLLMLVCAPLFVWSRPIIVFFYAAPTALRRRLGRFWARRRLGTLASVLMHPVMVWSAFIGIFVFWHIPGPYTLAVENEPIHDLEHLTLFITAFAFWSVVIEPSGRRRLDHGSTILFVAATAVFSSLPGALMILTRRPFYPVHASGVTEWGLTLIQDQQLAGLVMWIPGGFIYLAAIALLFAPWFHQAGRPFAVPGLRQIAPLIVLPILLVLVGCAAQGDQAAIPGFGNPDQGRADITKIGCGSCHIIPGIPEAVGLVGPPLDHMGKRIYVAGLLRNTPENLASWLEDPQKYVPGNAMPDMGLTKQQAHDIAAYLQTLE